MIVKLHTPSINTMTLDSAPSPQQVSQVERELIDCIRKKREMDRVLVDLEVQLYNYETSFLERYSQSGSIVKGFDPSAFLSLLVSPDGPKGDSTPSDSDRIFSSSSLTTQKALQLKQKSTYVNLGSRRNFNTSSKNAAIEEDEDMDEEAEEDEPYHEGKRQRPSAQRRKQPSSQVKRVKNK